MQSIKLEGKGPSFRICIVPFKDIAASSIFPLINRLLDGMDIKEGEESAFARSQIALNRNNRHLKIMLSA